MGMIFCSAIVPTVGRSSLSRAVESVLQQNIPEDDFEVLVINDSGKPLSWKKWQDSKKVQIVTTNQRERSVARNTGAAIAKGKYVHFLDDDDWLAPEAYLHLLELSQTNQQAKWLYGISQLVDRQNNPLIQLRHNLYGNCFTQVMSGEWIPLQASIIERETFMRIGGFDPLLTGPEDIDILRRILREEEIVETPNLVAYITMGNEGSTTDYAHHPHASRWAREIILNTPDAFPRMRSSADSPFWRGRIARVYLTSAVWNLKNRRLLTATDRIFFSIASLLSAGAGMFSTDFWKAILKPYASLTFDKGIREAKEAK